MAFNSTQQVQKTILSNGLTVLHEYNPSAPVVSMNMGVKVGSVWESDAEAGLSHLLEHMVFKGTDSFKPGEIASTVEALGGELNAYTSFDRTVYYINLPSQHWLKAYPFLKEMVFKATIDPIELDREREVVIEELRRGKDNPDSVLGEMVFEGSYPNHPYGRPIIGYEANLKAYTATQVMDFYKKWYVPNNMIFAICGNYTVEELQSVLKDLEAIPSRDYHRHEIPDVPTRHQIKYQHKASDVNANYLSIAFPITEFSHEDTPTLDLLAHLLGGGDTSLLEQELKEKRHVVNSIHAYAYTPLFKGLFIIDALVPNQHFSNILNIIKEQVDTAKTHLFSSQNLERAKAGMKSSLIYEKQTCEGTARKWLVYEATVGNYQFEEIYYKRLLQVSESDIRKMAQKYLKWDTATISTLYPSKTSKSLLPKPIKFEAAKQKASAYKLIEEFQDIQKWQHKTGYTVITKENHRLPILSFKMIAPGGVRHESSKNNGISNMMARLLEKGTVNKTALEIAEITEEISGHISGISGRNSWGVSSSMLSAKLEKGFDLFFDILLNPLFDSSEFSKEKRLILEGLKQEEDSLSTLAFKKFQSLLFKKHPYGMPLQGTKQSISNLTNNALKAFHKKLLNFKQTSFTCVGDFNTQDVLLLIEEKLKHTKSSSFKWVKPKLVLPPKQILQETIIKDKMQAHIVLGFMGTTVTNPDKYSLEIINNLLSGQGGRLFLDLRDTHSLAYSVTSTMTEGWEPGYFAAYIGTEAKKLDKATEGLKKHLKLLTLEPVLDHELERAKNYIIGSHELDLQRLSAYASTLSMNELYGFNLAEIENYRKKILAITKEDILRVAQKYFKMDSYVLAQVKPKNC